MRLQCVKRIIIFRNDELKPSTLDSHSKRVHSNFSHRPSRYFAGKLENLKKMKLEKSGAKLWDFIISWEVTSKPCLVNAVERISGKDGPYKKYVQNIEEQLVSEIKIFSPFRSTIWLAFNFQLKTIQLNKNSYSHET